jgi:hypothetical protein
MAARTSAMKDLIGVPTVRADLLHPGPKMLLMALTALPPAVVGLSAPLALEGLSGVLAGLWLALLPVALYRRAAAVALPVTAGALLLFAVLALPFNSPAFVVDYWSAATMLVLALSGR